MPEIVIKETRILAEDEIIDISVTYGVNKPLENSIKFEVLLLPILFLTN